MKLFSCLHLFAPWNSFIFKWSCAVQYRNCDVPFLFGVAFFDPLRPVPGMSFLFVSNKTLSPQSQLTWRRIYKLPSRIEIRNTAPKWGVRGVIIACFHTSRIRAKIFHFRCEARKETQFLGACLKYVVLLSSFCLLSRKIHFTPLGSYEEAALHCV